MAYFSFCKITLRVLEICYTLKGKSYMIPIFALKLYKTALIINVFQYVSIGLIYSEKTCWRWQDL